MGEKIDDMKGRAKEAAGDLTDDERLKREGKLDRAGAATKEKLHDAKDKLDDVVDKFKDKVSDTLDRDRQ